MESDNTSSHESFDLVNPDDNTEEIKDSIDSLLSLLKERIGIERNLELEIWKIRRKFDVEYQRIHNESQEIIRKIESLQKSNFWVTVMGNCPDIWEEVFEVDLDILDRLVDIRSFVITSDSKHESYPDFKNGLILEFEFAENDYFDNKILYKYYEISFDNPDGDQFRGAVPRCVGIKSSKINWKPGRNTTLKVVTKKQQNKKTKKFRTVTSEVPRKSFFNFFTEPGESNIKSDVIGELLEQDYELGVIIDSEIIGRAVLYYADMVPTLSDSDFSSADEYFDEDDEESNDSQDDNHDENDSNESKESEYDELKERISELFKNHKSGSKSANKGKGPSRHQKPKRG